MIAKRLTCLGACSAMNSGVGVDEAFVEALLTDTKTLFSNVHAFECVLHSVPGKSHRGLAITYQDILERREDFLRELKNTLCAWVYSKAKFKEIFHALVAERGGDEQSASSQVQKLVEETRRKGFPQGQFGELLLFNLLQHYFKAAPLLRKMPLTTNPGLERHGADAIHYRPESGAHIAYLGEAKTYSSKYKFTAAVQAALGSVMDSFANFSKELGLYVYQDFLDKDLAGIAKGIKNNSISNIKYELVCVVTYEEIDSKNGSNEIEIKNAIEGVINKKLAAFDLTFFSGKPQPVLDRIHLFVMPVWGLEALLQEFDK